MGTNLDANRGSGIHQAHKWVSSFNYRMSSLTGMDSRVMRHVLGDWQWTGILQFASGLPYTITSGRNYSLQGGTDRPNLVGDPKLRGDRTRGEKLLEWFNTAAFVRNDDGEFGDVARNSMIGPSFVAVDLAMHKNIAFTEDTNLQIRFEAFNLPNRPNFAAPVSNRISGSFGRVFGTVAPGRIIQIGAVFTF